MAGLGSTPWMRIRGFYFCQNWFPFRILQMFSQAFRWVVGVFSALVLRRYVDIIGEPQLRSGHPPMETVVPVLNKVFCILFSKILCNTIENGYLCRSSTVVRNKSPTFLSSTTALVDSSYNDLRTSINRLSVLYYLKTHHRPSCQTRSNAFFR